MSRLEYVMVVTHANGGMCFFARRPGQRLPRIEDATYRPAGEASLRRYLPLSLAASVHAQNLCSLVVGAPEVALDTMPAQDLADGGWRDRIVGDDTGRDLARLVASEDIGDVDG
jgi:hypothetical protein